MAWKKKSSFTHRASLLAPPSAYSFCLQERKIFPLKAIATTTNGPIELEVEVLEKKTWIQSQASVLYIGLSKHSAGRSMTLKHSLTPRFRIQMSIFWQNNIKKTDTDQYYVSIHMYEVSRLQSAAVQTCKHFY